MRMMNPSGLCLKWLLRQEFLHNNSCLLCLLLNKRVGNGYVGIAFLSPVWCRLNGACMVAAVGVGGCWVPSQELLGVWAPAAGGGTAWPVAGHSVLPPGCC